MAVTVAPLFNPTLLTGAAATIYTVPSSPTSLVYGNVRVRFTNVAAVPASVTAYAIPSGGTATATNTCLNAVSIAVNGYLDVDVPMLGPGGFFQAFGSIASDITVSCLNAVQFS